MHPDPHPPHTAAADLQRLYAVRPAWTGVRRAAEAIGLPPRCLLHAGPPCADPTQPSAPILAAAALCCVHEGWAPDLASARHLVRQGGVSLQPAQAHDVVTPLAAVMSASTPLVEVQDLVSGARSWSLLPSGAGPQIRFGAADPAVLERLRFRDQVLAPAWQACLAGPPVELIPLAQAGLRAGDDLHAQTTGATAALLTQLQALHAGQHARPTAALACVSGVLQAAPLFFLPLWMAACHRMLQALVGSASPDWVLGLAGNGQDVGIRLSGDPGHWLTRPASRPAGPRRTDALSQAGQTAQPAPMLGDSGVIDAAGFGAQAWGHATGVREPMAAWLPPGWQPELGALLGVHPAFAGFGLRTGLHAAQAHRLGRPLKVALAMLDEDAQQGLLGRGVCSIDAEAFGQNVPPAEDAATDRLAP